MCPKTILLVEDNPDDQVLTLRALKQADPDIEVRVVHDGNEAIRFLTGAGSHAGRDPCQLPRLVLLDLKLPKLDGMEVLRRLRADARTRLLPVVVLTTSTEERDIAGCYLNGANGYIRKPVDFAQFSATLREVAHYWLEVNEPPPLP